MTERVIAIDGSDVERLQAKLKQVAPGYEIRTNNFQLPSNDTGKPSISDWLNFAVGIRSSGDLTLSLDNHNLSVITLMQGVDGIRKEENHIEYFALTVAHSVLTGELKNSHTDSVEITAEVAKDFLKNNYYMNIQNRKLNMKQICLCPNGANGFNALLRPPQQSIAALGNTVDITQPPRVLYKYWRPPQVLDEEWVVMQDITMLKLDDNEVRANGTLLESTSRDAKNKLPQTSLWQDVEIEDISSDAQLKSYTGRKIICAGKRGTVYERAYLSVGGYRLGKHVSFILENNES